MAAHMDDGLRHDPSALADLCASDEACGPAESLHWQEIRRTAEAVSAALDRYLSQEYPELLLLNLELN